jgi:hypothetical protein
MHLEGPRECPHSTLTAQQLTVAVGILVAEVAATHPYTAAAPYCGSTTSANQEGHRTASCISHRKMALSACKQGTSKLNLSLLGDFFFVSL